jgi:hypothetical protein
MHHAYRVVVMGTESRVKYEELFGNFSYNSPHFTPSFPLLVVFIMGRCVASAAPFACFLPYYSCVFTFHCMCARSERPALVVQALPVRQLLRCWPGSSPTVLSRFLALVCRTHSTHCVVLQVVVLLVLLPLVLPRRLLTMRPLKRAAQCLQCSFSRLPSTLRALLLSVLYIQVSCASRCACVWPARCVYVPVLGLIVLCVDLASQTLTLGLCDVPQPLAAAVA